MGISKIIFAVYLFLAVYCAGSMTILQLQHFALYPKVGKEYFREYLQSNNKAAIIPAIIPALILLVTTITFLFVRPAFMSFHFAVIAVILNIINLASTAIWQGKLHGQLAEIGYNEALINQLINTNWIRTAALFIQGLIAVYISTTAIK
jgi:hypothetical protein